MSNSGQKQAALSKDWLPPGWVVKVKERSGGVMKDKYYIEPKKGHKFRSKKEVFRYLESGEAGIRKERNPRTRKWVEDVGNGGTNVGKMTQDRPVEKNTGGSNLGWQVKFVERENGVTEKYFVDPVNGYKFYSEKAIIHYLETREATNPKKKVDSVVTEEVETREATNPKKKVDSAVTEEVTTPKRSGKSDAVQETHDRSLGRPLDWLPQGWQVEFSERKNGTADKYYIDPVSGYKFRSRKDVSRYLEYGVFPARAGKKRKVNESPLSGQEVPLSGVTEQQILACRSTTKGFRGKSSDANDLENNVVNPKSSTIGEEKLSEIDASNQCMEGNAKNPNNLEKNAGNPKSSTIEEEKSSEVDASNQCMEGTFDDLKDEMVDDEVTYVLPVPVFSPEEYAVENQATKRGKGKSKPGREKSQGKIVPVTVSRKPKPDSIKSRKGKEPVLPCRSSRRLAELKPKKVDNEISVEARADVDTVQSTGEVDNGQSTGFIGIVEEVNEAGKANEKEAIIRILELKRTKSVIAMLFGESSSSLDPCLEFAYKTLAGIIPVENLPVKEVGSV